MLAVMSSRMNWDKARRNSKLAQDRSGRTRPCPAHRPHHEWRIEVTPRPPRHPPLALGFRRYAEHWVAYFRTRAAVVRAIEQLAAQGWHGRARKTPQASDRRTAGNQDRTATAGTIKDRSV